jgi:diguanylate cyclase (GGDEF)-like protein/PAS domain S-box-containing protein
MSPSSAHGRDQLFELSLDLMATIDRRGCFTDVNPAFERILGYPRAALIGLRAVDLLHPDDEGRTLALNDPAADSVADVIQFENRFRCNDGTYRWLQWNARLVKGTWYAVARDVTDRRSLDEPVMRDPLTGLPNRAALTDRLRAAVRRLGRGSRFVAVLLVDLDRFKPLVKEQSADAGDRILRAAAGRLVETAGPAEVVARLGGDQFVVLVEDPASPGSVLELTDRVVASFRRPLSTATDQVDVTASVGVAISSSPRITPRALLRHADIAMYRVKARGGDGHALYDDVVADQIEAAVGASAAPGTPSH